MVDGGHTGEVPASDLREMARLARTTTTDQALRLQQHMRRVERLPRPFYAVRPTQGYDDTKESPLQRSPLEVESDSISWHSFYTSGDGAVQRDNPAVGGAEAEAELRGKGLPTILFLDDTHAPPVWNAYDTLKSAQQKCGSAGAGQVMESPESESCSELGLGLATLYEGDSSYVPCPQLVYDEPSPTQALGETKLHQSRCAYMVANEATRLSLRYPSQCHRDESMHTLLKQNFELKGSKQPSTESERAYHRDIVESHMSTKFAVAFYVDSFNQS
jgi:hypothetical protein